MILFRAMQLCKKQTSQACLQKDVFTKLYGEKPSFAKGKHRRCDFANDALNCIIKKASTMQFCQ